MFQNSLQVLKIVRLPFMYVWIFNTAVNYGT